VEVRDAQGNRWPLDGVPRRPQVVIRVGGQGQLGGEPEPVMLLQGSPDDGLAGDLERAPLRQSRRSLRVPSTVTRSPGQAVLQPRQALTAGAQYTVAVGGWARVHPQGGELGMPRVEPLRVAEQSGGAEVTGSWPAHGTGGVPPELAMAAVRFDGRVTGIARGVGLEDERGTRLNTRARAAPCQEVGWPDGRCARIELPGSLTPAHGYRIMVTDAVRDRTGASIGPWAATFRTAPEGPAEPVRWIEQSCGLDERPRGPACVLADDRSLTLRARASAPVRAWLHTGTGQASTLAPRGHIELRLEDLEPDTTLEATLRIVDLQGAEQTRSVQLATTRALAPLSITEVRSDPNGPEPRQEYVEVLNSGTMPVDLRGYDLADRPDKQGDVVARSFIVPAGARALLVADGFDPSHPDDSPTPEGTVLVRLGTSLASGGLTNAGEPLFLRDPEGHRISSAPATPPPRPGVCRVRVASDGRTGAAGTFDYDAEDGCTPGAADRVP
jgi:hypothetical protein